MGQGPWPPIISLLVQVCNYMQSRGMMVGAQARTTRLHANLLCDTSESKSVHTIFSNSRSKHSKRHLSSTCRAMATLATHTARCLNCMPRLAPSTHTLKPRAPMLFTAAHAARGPWTRLTGENAVTQEHGRLSLARFPDFGCQGGL